MRFIETSLQYDVDLAVFFASYEERCTRVPRDLALAGYRGPAVVFYCGDLRNATAVRNAETISAMFGKGTRIVPVSYRDPVRMVGAMGEMRLPTSVLVDVSCFNRGNLFPFLWASQLGNRARPRLVLCNSHPEHYGDWLARDYHEGRNILGFEGEAAFSQRRFLLCAVGYEPSRALEVVRAVEPAKLVLTVGGKPTREEFLQRNRLTVQEVCGAQPFEVVETNVSDPSAFLVATAEIIAKHAEPDMELNIAPLSTKWSCLGIWAWWLRNRNVRLWDAQPDIYNMEGFSRGSEPPRYFLVEW